MCEVHKEHKCVRGNVPNKKAKYQDPFLWGIFATQSMDTLLTSLSCSWYSQSIVKYQPEFYKKGIRLYFRLVYVDLNVGVKRKMAEILQPHSQGQIVISIPPITKQRKEDFDNLISSQNTLLKNIQAFVGHLCAS